MILFLSVFLLFACKDSLEREVFIGKWKPSKGLHYLNISEGEKKNEIVIDSLSPICISAKMTGSVVGNRVTGLKPFWCEYLTDTTEIELHYFYVKNDSLFCGYNYAGYTAKYTAIYTRL